MPPIETTLGFFSLSLVLGFTPGPDNLFVIMQAASHGRRSGLMVLLGLCTGLLVHTAAVALGLAAVLAASAVAFAVLKYAGAAYLAYLAWQAYHAPIRSGSDRPCPPASPRRLYCRGILMNITNPKVALFFLAFLPQFVNPDGGTVAGQVFWFGMVFIIATLLAFGSLTYLAAFLGRLLRGSARTQTIMNRASALVFAGLAVRLAVTKP